ncbi:helix-turn-helix transcriptional regulator [Microvirga terricola]|uniref:Helix-turn-helix domain-containing protein n=1 Tax=Microvirga terricola TaxID=2719797 RepID=A0ABX0VCN7_9HYPH|nr:helix-turn-helix transcriptional regulator [Microvirga terricola]NIX76851.1 helix-turn-helix domain-containing protein [Microvirga terricola]
MLVPAVPASAEQNDLGWERRKELAEFLKLKRSAVSAVAIGLPMSARRRTKGLLREEVAQRAGTSTTWYTWLEQGRDVQASSDLVERLARALLLSDAEREYLHLLARPASKAGALTQQASPALTAWIDSLDPQPAYALNGVWDVIAWNEAATDLLGNFGAVAPGERNLLRLLFRQPAWRQLFVDWNVIVASAVAQFRAAMMRAPNPARAQTLVDTMLEECADFRRIWREGAVAQSELRTKRMRHPRLGEIELSFASVKPEAVNGDVTVTIYSPALPRNPT